MDAPQIDTTDLARLNETDKAELRNFIDMENQRTKHQRSTPYPSPPPSPLPTYVHNLIWREFLAVAHGMTDICWKKCFASATIRSGTLDGGEATCLANCVDRFYDLRLLTLKHLQNSRTQ